LVISKRLVELMRGSIGVESEVGRGSTFHFTIRAVAVTDPVRVVSAQPEPSMDPGLAERCPLRILLAEDVAVNQKLMVAILNRMGYRPDVVANGREVLEALARQPYDVVLMDVRMPEMDGLEASRRIGERYSSDQRPRIVALTANAMQEDRAACAAAGMDDYLAKPIKPADLKAALLRCAEWATSRPAAKSAPSQPQGPATSAEPTAGQTLTRASWQELYEPDSAEYRSLLENLLELFRAEIPPLLEAIRSAAAERNADQLCRAAHGVKGCAINLGAVQMAALSTALERKGRAGSLDDTGRLLEELECEFKRVCRAMEAESSS
jgi:CheY-like chemotaxis protein